jgi:hypothetical protein
MPASGTTHCGAPERDIVRPRWVRGEELVLSGVSFPPTWTVHGPELPGEGLGIRLIAQAVVARGATEGELHGFVLRLAVRDLLARGRDLGGERRGDIAVAKPAAGRVRGAPNWDRKASGIISMPWEAEQKWARLAWPGVCPWRESVQAQSSARGVCTQYTACCNADTGVRERDVVRTPTRRGSEVLMMSGQIGVQ